MHFATATEPGSIQAPSEDWAIATANLVIVLDGATARTDTGCVHGVTWFVNQLGPAIAARASEASSLLSTAVADAIKYVAALHSQCDLAHPGTPSAAVGVLRLTANTVEYFVLGDITVVLDTETEVQVITDNRVSLTAIAERAEVDKYPIGTPHKLAALIRMKHRELAARNRPEGYWVAETDPDAVAHALTGRITRDEVHRFAILTDGAARAITFQLYDWSSSLDLMQRSGPAELIHQVRAAESLDPKAIRWPRNKRSDDATVVFGVLTPYDRPQPRYLKPIMDDATKPVKQPVVAAIVTSRRGVLLGRRNDGNPLWTFIAGEIGPGESPTDAAIREVKEETGLLVRAADREIGRRVHPRTGRTMIYLACNPIGKTDVFVGDEDELAEVRWVNLNEAIDLLPGLFEPVRSHLMRKLG